MTDMETLQKPSKAGRDSRVNFAFSLKPETEKIIIIKCALE